MKVKICIKVKDSDDMNTVIFMKVKVKTSMNDKIYILDSLQSRKVHEDTRPYLIISLQTKKVLT